MIEYVKTLQDFKEKDFNGFFVGWKNPLNNKQLYNILHNSEYIVIAYDTDRKKVAGFINALSDEVNFAFIPMLEVLPDYQHQGIGTKLVELMLHDLDAISCIDLTCDPQLQSFYDRFGMKKSHGMILRKQA